MLVFALRDQFMQACKSRFTADPPQCSGGGLDLALGDLDGEGLSSGPCLCPVVPGVRGERAKLD